MSSAARHRSFVVVVPVKPPALGKSRLAGLPDARRRKLAAAFALDTVLAAARTPGVAAVLAVTDDFRFAARLREVGCEVVPDGVTDDLNATLVQACAEAARRWPSALPVALCADLPCLVPEELQEVLDSLPVQGAAFLRDRAGTGTTLYAGSVGDFAPRFGPSSAQAHVDGGAHEVGVPAPSARHDVDDIADLEAALRLGVGAHTAAAAGGA